MARTKEKEEKPVAKVRCCDCGLFQRDTEGPSRSTVTGEYFMGLCPKLHADGVIVHDKDGKAVGGRVFADKLRICKDYNND